MAALQVSDGDDLQSEKEASKSPRADNYKEHTNNLKVKPDSTSSINNTHYGNTPGHPGAHGSYVSAQSYPS